MKQMYWLIGVHYDGNGRAPQFIIGSCSMDLAIQAIKDHFKLNPDLRGRITSIWETDIEVLPVPSA